MENLGEKMARTRRSILLSMSLGFFLVMLIASSNSPMIFAAVPEGGGGGPSPTTVTVYGDDYNSISRSESGTGDSFYEKNTNGNYLKIEVKASTYWDFLLPRGGSADVTVKYTITPSASAAYDLRTTWNWVGKIFDDDANEVFVQLKITTSISGGSVAQTDVKTWGGNGYYVKSWNEALTLTHFSNMWLQGGVAYTVQITVHAEANGATPYSGTNYVDFLSGSREMDLHSLYIQPI